MGIGADDSCDLDLPTGITEEIAREIREQHRSRDRHQRRNGEPDGPIMTGEQGLRMHEARVRRAREAREGSRQIQMIQHIMERFGNREDVPDEWWAFMGWDDDARPESRGEQRSLSQPRSLHPLRHAEDTAALRRESREMQQANEIMQNLREQGSQEASQRSPVD